MDIFFEVLQYFWINEDLRKGALGSAKLEEECKENDEHWRQRDGPSQGNGPLGIEEGIILQGAILQPDQGKKHLHGVHN
jgi:hypothetical protein